MAVYRQGPSAANPWPLAPNSIVLRLKMTIKRPGRTAMVAIICTMVDITVCRGAAGGALLYIMADRQSAIEGTARTLQTGYHHSGYSRYTGTSGGGFCWLRHCVQRKSGLTAISSRGERRPQRAKMIRGPGQKTTCRPAVWLCFGYLRHLVAPMWWVARGYQGAVCVFLVMTTFILWLPPTYY
jgi:hypothetical protein